MSNNIEDIVRLAQQRQADRAPDPERIRAALPTRAARAARRRRDGTAVAIAAAVAVTVAVVVPVVVLRDGSGGSPSSVAPPSTAAGSATAVPSTAMTVIAGPVRYRPTWLPTGLVEGARQVDVGPTGQITGVTRTWKRTAITHSNDLGGPRLWIGHAVREPAGSGNDGKAVDINGRSGVYHAPSVDDDKSYVEWSADAGRVVTVSQHNLSLTEQDLLRVARSVQPDPAEVKIPVRLGHLPDGLILHGATLMGDSPTSWSALINGVEAVSADTEDKTGPDNKRSRSLTVEVGATTTAAAGGETLTVGGHPARLVGRGSEMPGPWESWDLVVELGRGRLLTIGGSGLKRAEMLAVGEAVEIDAQPDLAWLGQR